MARARLVVPHIGRKTASGFRYPSEAGYFESMRNTSRELVKALNSVIDQFENVSTDIMVEALEPTMELADYYCPKLTHALVNSRYLEATSRKGSEPRVEAGYGFRGKPYYAALVHERTWVPHRDPTRSKWLQAAMMQDLGNIYNRLADNYGAFMGSSS